MQDYQEYLNAFISYIFIEKGLAKNTAVSYRLDLMQFFEHLSKNNLNLFAITHQDITEFLFKLKTDGLKSSSIYRMMESIKQFYKFLVYENKLSDNPAQNIASPRIASNIPEILSVQEVDVLLKSIPDTNIINIRNRAMFELAYACALRVSELVALRFEDINFKENFLIVKNGKGSKQRVVPFGQTAKNYLEIYLRNRKPNTDPREFIFYSKKSKQVSRITVSHALSALAKKAGFTKRVYPHILRHSCASHLLNGGADIRFVAEILGHSSISTTQIYTHLDTKQIQQKHKQFHPRG
ncbi:MAG: tyrosine recombinase [Elusimicrobiota bacterium]|jgi:integrase/recombinase XerD|nr:tyrosine recombinase [Elusimicrobiota bacterium]